MIFELPDDMKKKTGMPSFLADYNSIWNPLLMGFIGKIMPTPDKCHILQRGSALGLRNKIKRKMIDQVILKNYGAKEIALKKDDVIFREGEAALNYFQVLRGSIKMITNAATSEVFRLLLM